MRLQRKRGESGSAIVELALLSPWIFFLFVGIFDVGFYCYDAISLQNAARVAALQTSANPGLPGPQLQTLACTAATAEMFRIPNIQGIAAGCNALPLTVTQQTLTNATTPACADCALDAASISSLVTVQYQSSLFVPIPGILTNQMTLTRTSEVRMVVP